METIQETPSYMEKSVILGALCQAVEAMWARSSTLDERKYARKTVKLILESFDEFESGSTYLMRHAADFGKTGCACRSAAYAIGYRLADSYGIAEGHAMALCLPYVWEHLLRNKGSCIDRYAGVCLDSALNDLLLLTNTASFKDTLGLITGIFIKCGVYYVFNYSNEVIETLAESVAAQGLSNHPVRLTENELRGIYEKVFTNNMYSRKSRYTKLWNNFSEQSLQSKDLRKIQALELDMLLEVNRVCNENHITYYLGEETLLGAVRINGFLPWAKGVNIVMRREDYERFCNTAPPLLPSHMILRSHRNSRDCFFVSARICMLNKAVGEQGEPCIDIYPLDYVPRKASLSQHLTSRKVKLFRYMLLYKAGILKNPSNIKKLTAYLLRHLFFSKCLLNAIERSIQKYNQVSCKRFVINYTSYHSTAKQTFYKTVYHTPRLIEFEGALFPVPYNYHAVLCSLYGNYKKLRTKSYIDRWE